MCTKHMSDILISTHKKQVMKRISIAIIIMFLAKVGFAQSFHRFVKSSASDPAINELAVTQPTGEVMNPDNLVTGSPVKIQFTVANNETQAVVPAGSCRIMLSLGTKFKLLTDLTDPQVLPLTNYFKWMLKQSAGSGQYNLFGILYRDLPANFSQKVSFLVQPFKEGSSTAICQLLISNERNPDNTLSDNNPNNNVASLSYTNLKAPAIKVVNFTAKGHACTVPLNWMVEDQDNELKECIIETSDDGVVFHPFATPGSSSDHSYGFVLRNLPGNTITVRIKAVAYNDLYVYSEQLSVKDICNTDFSFVVTPNPSDQRITEISLIAKEGIFNGKYALSITNSAGEEMKRIVLSYDNQSAVKLNVNGLKAGVYFIRMKAENGKEVIAKMIRL